MPLPHWGGPPHDPPITSYWQSWYWERSGSPGWALLLPGRGLQAGGISPGATPQWGPWSTPGLALVGWARGSVYRQPSLWRREPRGEGGAGASDWESEALGSACLMKERGANGDTEILIRGSLWGGIYYLALIGCVVASQHPGPGREPRNSPRSRAPGEAVLGLRWGAGVPFSACGILRPRRAQLLSSRAGSRGSSKHLCLLFSLLSLPRGPPTYGCFRLANPPHPDPGRRCLRRKPRQGEDPDEGAHSSLGSLWEPVSW